MGAGPLAAPVQVLLVDRRVLSMPSLPLSLLSVSPRLHPTHVLRQVLKGLPSGPRGPPKVLVQGLLQQMGVRAGVLQDGAHAQGVLGSRSRGGAWRRAGRAAPRRCCWGRTQV